MTEITLRPSKVKLIFWFLIFLMGIPGGILMVNDGEWTGHVAYLGSGLISIVFLIQLMIPGSSYLQLRDDEFEFAMLFIKRCIKWEDVESFGIVNVQSSNGPGSARRLGWDYKQGVEVKKYQKSSLKPSYGRDAFLPLKYGMKVEGLLSLMDEHLERSRTGLKGYVLSGRSK